MSHPVPESGAYARVRRELEAEQSARLLALLLSARGKNPFYREKLSGVRLPATAPGAPAEILTSLPLTTKQELLEDQARHAPFGSALGAPPEAYTRVHQTSGTSGRPLRWLDTAESWEWILGLWQEIFAAAGVGPQDVVFFPFSFGPFLGFWAAFEGATRVGALAVPGGGLSSPARLRLALELRATVLAATPTYALHLAEQARSEGIDLPGSPVRALIVAGEPGGSIASVRERLETAWGARVFDHCGMTEVGPYGFECAEAPGGLHVLERGYVVEVIDPVTCLPAEPRGGAREGELVLTTLGRTDSPLIRYRTGDFVRWSTEPCPCGRPLGRLEGGIRGRLDDMVFIRGNNVYPSAVEAILRRFPQVVEHRITARRRGELASLLVEVEPVPGTSERLAEEVSRALERELLFRSEVVLVKPGTLPRFELKGKRFFKASE